MAKVEIQNTTISKINEWFENNNNNSSRPHLGASEIGHPCESFLWFKFRHAFDSSFDGRMLQLFQRGHDEEPRLNKKLANIGVQVVSQNDDGSQYNFQEPSNKHFSGSMDAAALGLVEAPKTWHVIDYKTCSDKKFKKFCKDGTEKTEPKYYAQVQMYMHWTGMQRAMILFVNKNDDSMFSERFRYDRKEAERLIEKAKRVTWSNKQLSRISELPDHWECTYCDARGVCKGGEIANNNCRTCCYSTATPDGSWFCDLHNASLENTNGCDNHLYNPEFINAEMIEGVTKENWIKYRKSDGVEFVNGHGGYSSQEVKANFNALGDEKVNMVREKLNMRIAG